MLSIDEITRSNHELITDLYRKINDLKGYEAGYMLPSTGMMIISHNGKNFMITAELISTTDEATLEVEMERREYRFKAKEDELAFRKKIEEEEEKK